VQRAIDDAIGPIPSVMLHCGKKSRWARSATSQSRIIRPRVLSAHRKSTQVATRIAAPHRVRGGFLSLMTAYLTIATTEQRARDLRICPLAAITAALKL
jgi:hypothetical protein